MLEHLERIILSGEKHKNRTINFFLFFIRRIYLNWSKKTNIGLKTRKSVKKTTIKDITETLEFLPYKLRIHQVDCGSYILIEFSSEKIIHVPKKYNGVFVPSKNLIMLLGDNDSLDTEKWSKIVNHEILHLILYYLGIRDEEENEQIVRLLESYTKLKR